MNLMKSLVAVAVVLGGTVVAQAAPLECGLTFTAKGGGLQVLVGEFKLAGHGTLACQNVDGTVEKIPVKISFGGHLFAPKVAAGYLDIAGAATGIGYSSTPDELMGTYAVASAEGALVVGAGARVAFRAAHGTTTIDANIQAESGVGLDVGLGTMTLSRE